MNVYLKRVLGSGFAALALALGAFATSGVDPVTAVSTTGDRGTSPAIAAPIVQAVGPAQPTVAIILHNSGHTVVSSVPAGAGVHPSVSVTGGAGVPTGQVRVMWFLNGSCAGSSSNTTLSLGNGSVDATAAQVQRNEAATMSVRALYLGSAAYDSRLSPCAPVTWTRIKPAVTFEIHGPGHAEVTSLPVGSVPHLLVDVNGRLGEPTGVLTLSRWDEGGCTGSYHGIAGLELQGGELHQVGSWPSFGVGQYSFRVHYAGDETYASGLSACLPFSIIKRTPAFEVELHDELHESPSYVAVGTSVHAVAILAGDAGQPTGQVNIRRFVDGACADESSSQTIDAAALMHPAGTSQSWATPHVASWKLTYMGDAVYKVTSSPCLQVTYRAIPEVQLTLHKGDHSAITSGVIGINVHGRVEASSPFGTPTGQIKLQWFHNATCKAGTGLSIGAGILAGGVLHDEDLKVKLSTAGTYSLRATYGGNPTFEPTFSNCAVVTITDPVASPTTTPNPTPAPDPTSGPKPSQAPGQSTAPQPTAAGGQPTDAPSPSPAGSDVPVDSPASSLGAASTPAPVDSGDPAASAAPGDPGAGDPGAGGATPSTPSSPTGDTGLSWLLVLAVLVLVIGALAAWAVPVLGRKRRPQPSEA